MFGPQPIKRTTSDDPRLLRLTGRVKVSLGRKLESRNWKLCAPLPGALGGLGVQPQPSYPLRVHSCSFVVLILSSLPSPLFLRRFLTTKFAKLREKDEGFPGAYKKKMYPSNPGNPRFQLVDQTALLRQHEAVVKTARENLSSPLCRA